jgi:hypothetical protein
MHQFGSGGCYTKRTSRFVRRESSEDRTLGFASAQLREVDGALTLLYQGGDECPQARGHNASVLITFMCNERDRALACAVLVNEP